MYRLKRIFELCAILLLLALTPQCTQTSVRKDTKFYTIHTLYEGLKYPDFPKEIARLQAVAEKTQDMSGRAVTHLQLALLYSHYKNPAPNYHKALMEIETYVSLEPEGGKADVIQNWLTMLKEIIRLGRENKNIKENIEQLQYLDSELEKSRKQIK